jgi:hypothetical protein
MTMKATPGPWRLDRGHMEGYAHGVSGANGKCVIRFRGLAAPTSSEGQANSRLIAAAPDLLDIVRVVEEDVRRGECCPVCSQHPHDPRCMIPLALTRIDGEGESR